MATATADSAPGQAITAAFLSENPMEATMTEPTHQIAVLDRGFVYVGTCSIADDMLTITEAQP